MTRFVILSSISLIIAAGLKAEDNKPEAKESHDKLVQDVLKIMQDTTKILKDVKNKEQADKAKKDVIALVERMQDVKKRYAAAGELTKEKDAELEKKYKVDMDDAYKSLQAEVQRLQKAEYGKEIVSLLEQKPKPAGK